MAREPTKFPLLESSSIADFKVGSSHAEHCLLSIAGIHPVLKRIQETNDLGHPLCSNLRDGTWLSDYIIVRLKRLPELSEIARIYEEAFLHLAKGVPHFLRPCYFELIFTYLYDALE